MNESAPQHLDTVQPEKRVERPWWRLHASSVALAVLLLLAMTLIVVPGQCFKRELQQVNLDCEHGWPLTYYENSFVDKTGLLTAPLPPDWLRTDCWRFDGATNNFSPLGLLADALAVGLVVGVPVAAWEWRRRRRQRVLQFSLATLLITMLVVGLAVSYWVRNHQRRAAEVDESSRLQASEIKGYWGPIWLYKLLGEKPLDDLHASAVLILYANTPEPTDLSRLDLFSQLGAVVLTSGFTDEQLQRLPVCDCVTQVDVSGSSECTDLGLAELERAFPNLKELTLDGAGVTRAAVAALRLRRPNLKVTPAEPVQQPGQQPDDAMEDGEELSPELAPAIEEGAGGDEIIRRDGR